MFNPLATKDWTQPDDAQNNPDLEATQSFRPLINSEAKSYVAECLRISLQSPLNLNTPVIGGLQASTSIVLSRAVVFNSAPSYLMVQEENEQTESPWEPKYCVQSKNMCTSSFSTVHSQKTRTNRCHVC